MQIPDCLARLQQLLAQHGAEPAQPGFRDTWAAFTQFSREPVASASDGVLVEAGVYDFFGPERWCFSFVRQLEVVDLRGDHDHYVHVRCDFEFAPDDELRALDAVAAWCFPSDGEDIDAYFTGIEQLPEFLAASRSTPVEVRIVQEDV